MRWGSIAGLREQPKRVGKGEDRDAMAQRDEPLDKRQRPAAVAQPLAADAVEDLHSASPSRTSQTIRPQGAEQLLLLLIERALVALQFVRRQDGAFIELS